VEIGVVVKGKWFLELLRGVVVKGVSIQDTYSMIRGRPKHPPKQFSVEGIAFDDPDGTYWKLVLDVFIRQSYCPPGWEIDANDLVVDIGAHWGVFSAYASRRTSGRVIAFEPHPQNFTVLEALITRNGLINIVPHPYAIGANMGDVDLFISRASTRHSTDREDKLTNEQMNEAIRVPMLDLQSALADIQTVNYLKMDCEGSEFDIIMSADIKMLRRIKKMVIEYHGQTDSLRFNKILERIGQVYPVIKIKQLDSAPLGLIMVRQ
jgi:FkbM family methyltransferase